MILNILCYAAETTDYVVMILASKPKTCMPCYK